MMHEERLRKRGMCEERLGFFSLEKRKLRAECTTTYGWGIERRTESSQRCTVKV